MTLAWSATLLVWPRLLSIFSASRFCWRITFFRELGRLFLVCLSNSLEISISIWSSPSAICTLVICVSENRWLEIGLRGWISRRLQANCGEAKWYNAWLNDSSCSLSIYFTGVKEQQLTVYTEGFLHTELRCLTLAPCLCICWLLLQLQLKELGWGRVFFVSRRVDINVHKVSFIDVADRWSLFRGSKLYFALTCHALLVVEIVKLVVDQADLVKLLRKQNRVLDVVCEPHCIW